MPGEVVRQEPPPEPPGQEADALGLAKRDPGVLEPLARARLRREAAWRRRLPAWAPSPPFGFASLCARHRGRRRAGTVRPGVVEDGWRLLGELEERLSGQSEPFEALDDLCRWLSGALGFELAVVLTRGNSLEQVVACPAGSPANASFSAVARDAAEDGSLSSWVAEGSHPVHTPVLAPGSPLWRVELPPQVRSAVLVPLSAPGDVVGALFVHSPEPAAIGPGLVAVVERVAARLALVLVNARVRRALADLEGAQEAGRLREELLAALSHDMQTPLAVLLGSVKALQAFGDVAPEQRAGLYESMARRGAQLHRLVEQFLDYSRLEAGRPIEVRPSLIEVGAAVSRVEAEVGWRRPLKVEVDDNLPPAFVDPDRLDQVLANLVSNAVKFSPADAPISLRARATDEAVEIDVVDRGRGMDEEELERAFLKFHRGPGAKGTRGTGLGLYVSRAVIEAQGGRLEAESRPDHGSRFTVVLPLHPSLSTPAGAGDDGEPEPTA